MSPKSIDMQLANFVDRNNLSTKEYEILKNIFNPETTNITIGNSDDVREKLWCDVVSSVASASNSTNEMTMIRWADTALTAFDERFRK